MASSSTDSRMPLVLQKDGTPERPNSRDKDDVEYARISGSASPKSGAGSPTAREVRIECKDGEEASAPGVGSPRHGQAAPQPFKHKLLLGGSVVALGAAVGALALICHAWTLPETGRSYRRVADGKTCEEFGYHTVDTAAECALAAETLDLDDKNVSLVPLDAVQGMSSGAPPQDCYYMVATVPKKMESLFFNAHKTTQKNGTKPKSESSSAVKGIQRQSICSVPPASTRHARTLVKDRGQDSKTGGGGGGDDPWSQITDSVHDAEVAFLGVVMGTTTTTTTTITSTGTTTSTITITTSTLTTTTITTTSTTVTETTTSSSTTTSTSSTSTMTTTYHDYISLFCFSVMRVNSYEYNNMRTALWHKTSIFACNDYVLFADKELDLSPGEPVPGWGDLKDASGDSVRTVLLRQDLTTHPKAGALEGILNTRIFMQAWHQVNQDGRFRMHDWTVKVDPDAVFLPTRLRTDIMDIAPPSTEPNLYLVNCKISFGLFGAVEVFSRKALETYINGESRCMDNLDWHMMGEDLWMRKCFDYLGVKHEEDLHMLSDGYCSDAPSPCQSGKVAFHPFKSALGYNQCYIEAITPTTTTTTYTKTVTVTKTHTREHKRENDDEEESDEDYDFQTNIQDVMEDKHSTKSTTSGWSLPTMAPMPTLKPMTAPPTLSAPPAPKMWDPFAGIGLRK